MSIEPSAPASRGVADRSQSLASTLHAHSTLVCSVVQVCFCMCGVLSSTVRYYTSADLTWPRRSAPGPQGSRVRTPTNESYSTETDQTPTSVPLPSCRALLLSPMTIEGNLEGKLGKIARWAALVALFSRHPEVGTSMPPPVQRPRNVGGPVVTL